MTQIGGKGGATYPLSSVALFDIGLTETDLALPLDHAGEMLASEAADYLRLFPPPDTYEIGDRQLALIKPALDQIAGAIEDGSVLPGEASRAVQWATGQPLGGYLPKDMILNGGLADKLTLWGLDHGRLPELPGAQQVSAQAKLSPKARTIRAPGVASHVVRAITESSAALWSNVLSLTASITDQIVAEVRAVGYVAGEARSQAISTQHSLDSHVASTEVAIRTLRADLKAAIKELDKLAGGPKAIAMGDVLKRVEEYISHHQAHGTDKVIAGIQAAQRTDAQRLGGQQLEIVHLAAGVAELTPLLALKPLLQLKGTLQKLPTELKTLEDCCYANSQVTQPIRAGGATPSLLSQLGNVLKHAAEIFFGISIADAILGFFDMPLEVLTAIQSAELIVGPALRATAIVTADVSFAGKVAGVS